MLKGHKSTVYCVDYANDGKDVSTVSGARSVSGVTYPLFIVDEKPFQRFYWPGNAIDWQ